MPIRSAADQSSVHENLRSCDQFDLWTLIRKTSLLRIVPTACGQAADIRHWRHDLVASRFSSRTTRLCSNARRLRIARDFHHGRLSERSYLFTMSDITRATALRRATTRIFFSTDEQKPRLVEPDGIEPTTSCLQSRRSPN